MTKSRLSPAAWASRRSRRTHRLWKVEIQLRTGAPGSSASTRSFISPAALLVKVTARIASEGTPRSRIRCAMRCVITRVLPLPAPARMSTGPSVASTASRCWGLRPTRRGDSSNSEVWCAPIAATEDAGRRSREGALGSRLAVPSRRLVLTFVRPFGLHDLARASQSQRKRRHVLGDDAARSDVSPLAHRHRRHERRVAADERTGLDARGMLVLAVVVAGDRSRADVHRRADGGVAQVRQVRRLRAFAEHGLLELDEVADPRI